MGTVGFALGYRPGLDGLRSVALVLVLALHAGVPGVPGGWLGVDLFFVLSGFLITALLLEEHGVAGKVDLRAFWGRRWRRLAPALVLLLAVVVLVGGLAPRLTAPTPLAVAGGLTWTLNLVRSATGEGLGMLTHLWSLGVEEQFYLAWPPLLVLARRRSVARVAVVSAVLVVAVVAWRAQQYGVHGWFPLYSRTDTRLDALMVGSWLAAAHHAGWIRPRLVRRLAVPAALVLAVFVVTVPRTAAVYYLGGFTLVAAAAAVVIAHVVAGGWTWLRARPLVWLGRRSYAMYLWHSPVLVWAADLGVTDWWTALGIGFAGSVGLAALSWPLEQRFRARTRRARPDPVLDEVVVPA